MIGQTILKAGFFSCGLYNSCDVLITHLGFKTFKIKNKKDDNSGRILMLDVKIDGIDFVSNIHNANTEIEQIQVLNISPLLLDILDIYQNKQQQ